jgi:hypothetical protein
MILVVSSSTSEEKLRGTRWFACTHMIHGPDSYEPRAKKYINGKPLKSRFQFSQNMWPEYLYFPCKSSKNGKSGYG